MVTEEMVFLLPVAIAVELAARNLVEVYKGHTLLCCHVSRPFGLWLSDNLSRLIIVGIAWGQRHQYRMGTGLPALGDILSEISTIAIYSFLLSCLLDGDAERVCAYSRYHSPCPSLIVGTIIVVSNGYYHPVALPQGFSDHRPQLVIESTCTHTAKGLVLDAYLVGIEILAGKETPTPLTVGAITLGTIAHGGVTNKEQHGIVTLTGSSGFRS